MSDEALNGMNDGAAGPAETNGPQFTVEKIYVKDVSFEVPNAPQVFSEPAQPQLQMNLNQRVQRVGDNAFEVVLGITLTCTAGEKTAYLAEVQQAGIFGLAGFDEATLDGMLGTQAGGFPPFLLQPINFEALYAEGLRQRATQGNGDLATSEPAGNA
jgi:preprotein translocase subunit SecB